MSRCPKTRQSAEAMEALRKHEEILESLNTLFLVDENEQLKASVPLSAPVPRRRSQRHSRILAAEPLIHVDVKEKQDRITEMFDKYNLLALPVLDEAGKLAGVITADEVISLLRHK